MHPQSLPTQAPVTITSCFQPHSLTLPQMAHKQLYAQQQDRLLPPQLQLHWQTQCCCQRLAPATSCPHSPTTSSALANFATPAATCTLTDMPSMSTLSPTTSSYKPTGKPQAPDLGALTSAQEQSHYPTCFPPLTQTAALAQQDHMLMPCHSTNTNILTLIKDGGGQKCQLTTTPHVA